MRETERSIVMALEATHASGLTNFLYRTLLTPQPRSPHLLALLLGVGTGTRSVVRARLGRVLLPRQSLSLLSRPKIQVLIHHSRPVFSTPACNAHPSSTSRSQPGPRVLQPLRLSSARSGVIPGW